MQPRTAACISRALGSTECGLWAFGQCLTPGVRLRVGPVAVDSCNGPEPARHAGEPAGSERTRHVVDPLGLLAPLRSLLVLPMSKKPSLTTSARKSRPASLLSFSVWHLFPLLVLIPAWVTTSHYRASTRLDRPTIPHRSHHFLSHWVHRTPDTSDWDILRLRRSTNLGKEDPWGHENPLRDNRIPHRRHKRACSWG